MLKEKYELHFAPLQGYTDLVFRNAFAKYFGGADVYYTPFVRVEKGELRKRDVRELEPEVNRVPCLVPQILPGSVEEFRLLADLLQEKGYRRVDINLGCPFPLIAGKRKGAGMLPYPELVQTVMHTIEEYPEISFSVKMRLGWERPEECLLVCDVLNPLPLLYVTVHARTGKQQYKGEVQREAFAAFYEQCRHPVVYNGDLRTPEDIRGVLADFPALRGVAIGRGLLAEPWLGVEYAGQKTFLPEERRAVCAAFHEELFAAYSERLQGESQLLMKMKTLWEYFLPDTDRKLLKQIKKANKLSQYRESVQAIFR